MIMNMKLWTGGLLICVAHCLQVSWGEDLGCAARATKYGVVCVCNSSYCDTVTRPNHLSKVGRQYFHYVTGQDSAGFTRTSGHFNQLTDSTSDNNNTVVFTVNSTTKYQEILGFGGSFTDSAGIAVDSLPEEAQAKFIESYFSENGLEHSMARIPIGCSDFSRSIYTYDDQQDDGDLSNFGLAEEDYLYKIPLIQKAMNASPHDMKFVGCSFTAPSWMKSNDEASTGYILFEYMDAWAKYHIKLSSDHSCDCGADQRHNPHIVHDCLGPKQADWAFWIEHFFRFLDAYADHGINFWTITGGNEVMEPYFIGASFSLGTLALPVNHRYWLKEYLGPQLRASNHSQVQFAPLDDMRCYAKYWMTTFAAYPECYEMVSGIALHWYYDWLFPASSMDDFHQTFPDKLILYTESSPNNILFGGDFLEPGSWHRGALYAYNIIENLNHWTSVYLDWNLALNTQGGPYLQLPLDAAIIVNKTGAEFFKNPMFYTVGHFSKFIPPGSRRVDVRSNLNLTKYSTQEPRRLDPQLMSLLFRQKTLSRKHFSEADAGSSSTTPETVLPTFPSIPTAEIPTTVSCVATANPDNSTTVVVFNSMDDPVNVTIVDVTAGSISVTLAAQSLNTFLYWPKQ